MKIRGYFCAAARAVSFLPSFLPSLHVLDLLSAFPQEFHCRRTRPKNEGKKRREERAKDGQKCSRPRRRTLARSATSTREDGAKSTCCSTRTVGRFSVRPTDESMDVRTDRRGEEKLHDGRKIRLCCPSCPPSRPSDNACPFVRPIGISLPMETQNRPSRQHIVIFQ